MGGYVSERICLGSQFMCSISFDLLLYLFINYLLPNNKVYESLC